MTEKRDLRATARHDRQVEGYILAIDRGDLKTVADILKAAETDPELDTMLVEADAALHAEAHLTAQTDDAGTVRALLQRHPPGTLSEQESGPPTVGDVAARMQAEHATGQQPLLPDDLATNQQLVTDRTPLDRPMTGKNIRDVAKTLEVAASDRYWTLFQRAGVALVMARTSRGRILAAARDRYTRKRPANWPSGSDPS